MNNEIGKLIDAIKNCSIENSYKMSWLRSIVEYVDQNENPKIIPLEFIARCMFKHYWDQTIFFQLQQGQNPKRNPIIVEIVKNEIHRFQKESKNKKPEFFLRIENQLNIDLIKIIKVIKNNVIWRFKQDYDLYEIDNDLNQIVLHDPIFLKKHAKILYEIINNRWALILEDFNSSPRIGNKIRGTEEQKIKRKNLKIFHTYLEIENPKKVCFLTGDELSNDELSVHHVIPWSYMYSDDLWNLVFLKKSQNSSLSNNIPSQNMINKLKLRNQNLLNKMENMNISNKVFNELKNAIDKDHVTQFWIGCKG